MCLWVKIYDFCEEIMLKKIWKSRVMVLEFDCMFSLYSVFICRAKVLELGWLDNDLGQDASK